MRNILSFHKIDYSKAIDAAIQACLSDNKACMSSIANKGHGGLSSVKLPADTSYFGYIPNIKSVGYNWQTNAHRETTTAADQFWQWALYNDDGTVNKTYRQDSSFPRGRGHVGYGVHTRNQSSRQKAFTFPWVDGNNTAHGLSELYPDLNSKGTAVMTAFGVGGKGKYTYVFGWGGTTDWGTVSIGVFNSDTKESAELFSYFRGQVEGYRFIETKNAIRVYMAVYDDDRDNWGGYVEIDKNLGTAGGFVSLGRQNVLDFMSTHPSGEYEDLEGTTPYINLGTHSQGAFFNGQKVGTGGYFQRGWDNKAQAYIYRPVDLVTSSGSGGGSGGSIPAEPL